MSHTDTEQTGPSQAQSAGGCVNRARLKIENVSKTFGAVRALKDVGFDVLAGEVHGLIGENGAGKSTLMAIASGALDPDAGSVEIDGVRIDPDPAHARSLGLGIVRQHPALFPELTVADNLLFGLTPEQRSKIKRPYEWARECLDVWDDRPDIDPRVRVSMLNPEQQFILEISRALFLKPGVLVLDEPSEHLSAEGVDRLFERIRALAAAGSAIVYISHRIREIREISDRVTVLRDGAQRGTRATPELSEEEIVELIVGRSLAATFPPKNGTPVANREEGLVVGNFSGARFEDVSLSVRRGEIVGLAGIDDNGQADIARALAGLERSTGNVRFGDRRLNVRSSRASARAGISYIPADRHREGIYSELSVRDNALMRGIDRVASWGIVNGGKQRSVSEGALARFQVKTPHPQAPISSLSGGNQQKVVMTAALLTEPDVVIADQPTQGVDVGAKAEIYSHLREIAEGGGSVLMLSSDNTELAGTCDRVHVVSRGRIVATIEGDDLSEERITDAVLRAESRREHVRAKPSTWARLVDSDFAPVPVLLAFMLLLAVFIQTQNDNYLSSFNLKTVLHLGAVLAMASLAQGVVMMRGGIDLSVGPVMSMTLVIASFFIVDGAGFGSTVFGWLLILLFCLSVGFVNWVLIDRLKVHPVLATFGTWTLLDAIALLLRPTAEGTIASGVFNLFAMKWGFLPLALVIVVVVAVVLERWRTQSMSGKRLMASGNDPQLAAKIGVSPSRTALRAYLMSAALAGIAGLLLIGRAGVGDPSAGSVYTLQSVAAAVVGGVSLFGGRGSFFGIVVAALLLTQVRTATTFLGLNDAWQNILLAVVTVGAVFMYSIVRRKRA